MSKAMQQNKIEHFRGRGDMRCVRLVHPLGGEVVVSEYGAQVLSWVSPAGREVLFLSEHAIFEKGHPIRGGIPIVFPQFSKRGSLPAHGFARTKLWQVVRETVSNADAVAVTLRLEPDAETRTLWPHEFVLELDIVLSDVLLLTMRVENRGETSFSYSNALHTYLRVGDISTTTITGLKGVAVEDFLNDNERSIEERERVVIDGAIDRVYTGSSQVVTVFDDSVPFKHTMVKEGFPDAVIWNPGPEGAKEIADMENQEYESMLCVESGCVVEPAIVAPGQTNVHAQIMRVVV